MRIGFSMPAFNEELLLAVSVESVAPLVDHLVLIDDGSSDRTAEVAAGLVKRFANVELIRHPRNRGVGAAVVTGLRALLARPELDALGIIGSDNQCDPALIPRFREILAGRAEVDVVKGSRFLHPASLGEMPRFRYWGNRGVSLTMQLLLGYKGMSDVLHGYLLARRRVFEAMDLDQIADGYDLENTMMCEFRRLRCRFVLLPSPSRYKHGAVSSIVYRTQIPRTLGRMGAIAARRLATATPLEKAALALGLIGVPLLPLGIGALPLAASAGLTWITSPKVETEE